MNLILVSTFILCILFAQIENTFINAQKSNSNSVFDNVPTLEQFNETMTFDLMKLFSKYDSGQINEVIYRIYEDFRNSNESEIGHYHDIAVLIDFICGNEYNENSIEACDILSELPVEDPVK